MHVETEPIDALGTGSRGQRIARGAFEPAHLFTQVTQFLPCLHARARKRVVSRVCIASHTRDHVCRSAVSRSAEDCVRSRKCRSDLQPRLASEPSRQIASLRRDRMPQHGVWNGPCELWFVLSESVSCLGRMKNAQRAHTLQVSQRARFAWQI